MAVTQFKILLVEDNPGDARLVEEVLRECTVPGRIDHVSDGIHAMAYLRRQGSYAEAESPDLILLDLNLPRKSGREVLAEIKGDEELGHIPVIVLTTSVAEDDVRLSYRLHANAYISKPVEFDEFTTVARSLEAFWLSTARLPSR